MEAKDDVRDARRGLLAYLVPLAAATAVVQGDIMVGGGTLVDHPRSVFLLMWLPALVSIAVRLLRKEGFGDVSFRLRPIRGAWREWLLAWLLPVFVGAASYGAAWGLGLAPFEPPQPFATWPPVASFVLGLGLNLTLGTALSCVSAVGEEIGWRGYMLTRLISAKLPYPILTSGLVWGAWHLPLIVFGQYAAGPQPILSPLLFMINITAGGYLHARVRLLSGSIWPAVLLHGSWNAIIQGSYDAFTSSHDAARAGTIWVGESGVLVMLCNVAVAAWLVRDWRRRERNAGAVQASGHA